MDPVPPTLAQLVDELERLPGVGRRTAERLAHHLLRVPAERALALAEAIRTARACIAPCSRCRAPAEADPCPLCSDPQRDDTLLLVVETARDLVAIEASRAWRGRYFVLGGRLAPHEGEQAGELGLEALVARASQGVREVVLATNPDLEGDGTALLLAETLRGQGVSVSRLARGLPAGGLIEHQSASVLGEALEGRRHVT
ncbi:MAG: recombination mediator RecR [Planctomycetia bacterium]